MKDQILFDKRTKIKPMQGFLLAVFVCVVIMFFVSLLIYVGSEFMQKQMPQNNRTLVILVPGLSLQESDYQYLVNDLKNNNYNVVTYKPTLNDPTDYEALIEEWSNGITGLAGREKVVVIGHSVGGAAAVDYCSKAHNCLAGVNMDGGPSQEYTLTTPFLYIEAAAGDYCDDECLQRRGMMENIVSKSDSEIIKMNDIKHYNFIENQSQQLKDDGLITEVNAHKMISDAIISFLQKQQINKQ